MSDRNATDPLNVRLPLYTYTSPLWRERRVLEIGCGEGASAAFLARNGAAEVVSLDIDVARLERARTRYSGPGVQFLLLEDLQQLAAMARRFDVVFVPDGESILTDPDAVPRLRGLLRDGGFVVVAVSSSERQSVVFRGGVSYYDLADTLAREFRVVRMLGQTPFLGFGLVEFNAAADALRVDASLLGSGTEQPSHYIAVAGNDEPPALGQVLVQVPFSPIEALAESAAAHRAAELAPPAPPSAALPAAEREIARLKAELTETRLAVRAPTAVADSSAATLRADLAERRLEEIERRARARGDEADTRITELRRKLEEALIQSESSVRVARAQADEIEELRARLRRSAEDRSLGDIELGKLRRALAEADDSVLTLTRRTAEEMAVVAQRLVTGFGTGLTAPVASAPLPHSPELEGNLRRAEEAVQRAEAELATFTERLRAADEQIRALKQQTGEVGLRDDRIARLEGDKQDLLWRVAELEEKLRHAEQDAVPERTPPEEIAKARASRDRAIEEFHRAAATHVTEVSRLQASVQEHAALVAELEDSLRLSDARGAVADKEATTLRRNAKELEEADRMRRGRLSELEGKLLRIEREKAMAAGRSDGGDPAALDELTSKLQAAEQRASSLEQRTGAAEQGAVGANERAAAAEQRAAAAEARAVETERRAAVEPRVGTNGQNGFHGNGVPTDEVRSVIEDAEARLRDEVRTLGQIEETLGRAEALVASAPSALDRAEWERTVASKDGQLVEMRLELARVKREAELARLPLERELTELRAKLHPDSAGGDASDMNLNGQLILMHSTLGNIRRRAARLRDELEGFRRRIDTLPPGALSSMLEEIGEDLGEFAK
ncbi:MAG TPA: methyltransferase domain-containing protein [Polyangia bacterium]|jgi:hypothetical protein